MGDREKQIDEMIEGWSIEWFKNHIVERHTVVDSYKGRDMEVLIWREPGKNTHRIDYFRVGHVLFVAGDVGEAVYVWSENVSLEWISKLNLDYFASKCMASEVGRGYKAWSEDKAQAWLKDHFAPEEGGELTEEQRTRLDMAEDYSIWEAIETQEGWYHWLENYGHDVFDSDYCGVGSIGKVVHIRCQIHLAGLRMAFERVAKDKGDGK